jgi:hypothetical protein
LNTDNAHHRKQKINTYNDNRERPNDTLQRAAEEQRGLYLDIKCKKRYRFKKATLYEREVIKKQKFFIRWQKLPYSYNMWLGNRSFYKVIKKAVQLSL